MKKLRERMDFLFFDWQPNNNTSKWFNENVTQKHIDLLECIVKSNESELESIDKHIAFYNFFGIVDKLVSKWKISFCALRKYFITTAKYRQHKHISGKVNGTYNKSRSDNQRVGTITIPLSDIMAQSNNTRHRSNIWGIRSIKIRFNNVSPSDIASALSVNERAKKTDHYDMRISINFPITNDIANPYNSKWNKCHIIGIQVNKLELTWNSHFPFKNTMV